MLPPPAFLFSCFLSVSWAQIFPPGSNPFEGNKTEGYAKGPGVVWRGGDDYFNIFYNNIPGLGKIPIPNLGLNSGGIPILSTVATEEEIIRQIFGEPGNPIPPLHRAAPIPPHVGDQVPIQVPGPPPTHYYPYPLSQASLIPFQYANQVPVQAAYNNQPEIFRQPEVIPPFIPLSDPLPVYSGYEYQPPKFRSKLPPVTKIQPWLDNHPANSRFRSRRLKRQALRRLPPVFAPQLPKSFQPGVIQVPAGSPLASQAGQLPGNPPLGSIPGLGGDIPGLGGDVPGMGGSVPGMGGDIPGMGGDIPGMGGGIPGMGGDIPGMGGDIPGMGGDIPGMGGDIPGMGGSVPGMGGDIPGMGGDIPGMGGDIPGVPSGGSVPGMPQGSQIPFVGQAIPGQPAGSQPGVPARFGPPFTPQGGRVVGAPYVPPGYMLVGQPQQMPQFAMLQGGRLVPIVPIQMKPRPISQTPQQGVIPWNTSNFPWRQSRQVPLQYRPYAVPLNNLAMAEQVNRPFTDSFATKIAQARATYARAAWHRFLRRR